VLAVDDDGAAVDALAVERVEEAPAVLVVADAPDDRDLGAEAAGGDRLVEALAPEIRLEDALHGLAAPRGALDAHHQVHVEAGQHCDPHHVPILIVTAPPMAAWASPRASPSWRAARRAVRA